MRGLYLRGMVSTDQAELNTAKGDATFFALELHNGNKWKRPLFLFFLGCIVVCH